MRALVLALVLVGCTPIWDLYPVTPRVSALSTYTVHGAIDGVAWVVTKRELVTAGIVCKDKKEVVIEGYGTSYTAVVLRTSDLCLLRVMPTNEVTDGRGVTRSFYPKLKPALIVSRAHQQHDFHKRKIVLEGDYAMGSPINVEWHSWGSGEYGYGVFGVRTETGVVRLRRLREFLRNAGVVWRKELRPIEAWNDDGHAYQESGVDLDPVWMHYGERCGEYGADAQCE